MRASSPGGRFSINYEIDSYTHGIKEDLQRPVGGELPWLRFDPEGTEVDPIYDVGAYDGGRSFHKPRMLKFITAQVFQGQTDQSDRGFYNADHLRLTINRHDFENVFPKVVPEVDQFLKDRVKFQGSIFRPSRIYLRGWVADTYTIITMDLIEVMDEEQVNDLPF